MFEPVDAINLISSRVMKFSLNCRQNCAVNSGPTNSQNTWFIFHGEPTLGLSNPNIYPSGLSQCPRLVPRIKNLLPCLSCKSTPLIVINFFADTFLLCALAVSPMFIFRHRNINKNKSCFIW